MADQTLGSEIDIKLEPGPVGLSSRRIGSGRRRIHEEGKQQCLWLGTGPEAEAVLKRFKEVERREGFKQHKTFLSHLLTTNSNRFGEESTSSINYLSRELPMTAGSNGLTACLWNGRMPGEPQPVVLNGHGGQQCTSVTTDSKPLECSQPSPSFPEQCTDDPSDCSSAFVSQNGLHFGIEFYSQLVVGRLSTSPLAASESDDLLVGDMPRKRKRLHTADDMARAAAETLMELGGSIATQRTVLPRSSRFSGISLKPCYPFTVVSGDGLPSDVQLQKSGGLVSVDRDLRDVSPLEGYSSAPVDERASSGSSAFIVGRLPLAPESLLVSQQGASRCVELSSGDGIESVDSSRRSVEQVNVETVHFTGEGNGENFEEKDSPSLGELKSQKFDKVHVTDWVGLVWYMCSSYSTVHRHVMYSPLLAMQFLLFIVSLQYIGVIMCSLLPVPVPKCI